MTTLTIEALGISKEEAAERVIQKIADQVLFCEDYDEDGNPFRGETAFRREVEKAIRERIDQEVQRLGDTEIEPRVAGLIEGATLQATNAWGEKLGEPKTFREYLVARAETYMTEQVNYEGKSKSEVRDSFGWNSKTTRVAYLINKHLHYEIEQAMKAALANVNSTVAKGLHEATKIAINEITGKLKVKVEA